MTGKDYYVVLGVPRSESPTGIRNAFHELALEYHPDRGGPNATPFFQEIVEAYDVLSDPGRRASYDRGLQHAELAVPRTPVFVRPEPEPLVPEPISLMHDFEVTRPSTAEVLDRFLQNFTEAGLPKSRRLDALEVDLTLDPEEAVHGGALTLEVPVFYPCARCHGSGREWQLACVDCGGSGLVEEEEPVRVTIPPGVHDGTAFELPLRGLGVNNLHLRLVVRVDH
jgi:DnaJ-class molecular chaperone